MVSKVEKFEMSSYFTNGTQERIYQSTTTSSKRPSQVLPTKLLEVNRPSEETCDDSIDLNLCSNNNVALNLCPDGSEVNISINGTTLTATKSSLNVTIGNFTINVNSLIKGHTPMPSLVAVISITQGTPLHVVHGDSPDVKATLPFSKL